MKLNTSPVTFCTLLCSFMLVLFVACCGSSVSEASARSALNFIADTVDPSYQLAMQGCVDLEDHVMREGEAGQRTAASTETELTAISARCHKIAAAFDEIRHYHSEALELVNAGHYEEALTVITKTREAWRTLRERTGSP